jgi:hypothetical protein
MTFADITNVYNEINRYMQASFADYIKFVRDNAEEYGLDDEAIKNIEKATDAFISKSLGKPQKVKRDTKPSYSLQKRGAVSKAITAYINSNKAEYNIEPKKMLQTVNAITTYIKELCGEETWNMDKISWEESGNFTDLHDKLYKLAIDHILTKDNVVTPVPVSAPIEQDSEPEPEPEPEPKSKKNSKVQATVKSTPSIVIDDTKKSKKSTNIIIHDDDSDSN